MANGQSAYLAPVLVEARQDGSGFSTPSLVFDLPVLAMISPVNFAALSQAVEVGR